MFIEKHAGVAFATAYLGISTTFFVSGYLLGDATFWMGIILIPMLLRCFPVGAKSWRFAPLAALLATICCFRPELSWRFLLVATASVFAIESLFGRLNAQVFAVLLIISPIFKYFSEVFTFPIRLQISACAGKMLQTAGMLVVIEGNSILLNGSEFSVDPACMGLQMTGFALLAVTFLIAHFRVQDQKSLDLRYQLILLFLAFSFNIIGNLMRVVMLVMLRIAPDNALHDGVGIVCLVVYVVTPLIYIVRYTHRRFGKTVVVQTIPAINHPPHLIPGNLLLLAVCTFFCFQKPVMNVNPLKSPEMPTREGYAKDLLKSGVTRFRSNQALVYIKPIPAFYSSEHSPVTCWTGSGYHLSRISKKHLAGRTIYIGSLRKGNDELYTAWWLSDGRHATINQFDWRWKSLTGHSRFRLINVTTETPARLDLEVKQWLPAI